MATAMPPPETPSESSSPGYKAFISYSRDVDGKLAPTLRTALHRFARPWLSRRAMRVFLDQSVLSTSPGLWSSIERALSKSEFFLLLASPEAKVSKWVQKEVNYWLKNRSPKTLLIVLTDGEIVWDPATKDFDWTNTTSLPETLGKVFDEEPLFLDLRWARGEYISLRDPRLRDRVASLSATLQGRSKDELVGDDVRQQRKLTRAGWTAGVLLATFAALAVWQAVVAIEQRQIAEDQRDLAQAATNSEREARQEEERQRRLAEEQRQIAEDQRDLARTATNSEREARQEEERQRELAESRLWEANYNSARSFEEKAGAALAEARPEEAWLYTLAALEQEVAPGTNLPVSVGRLLDPKLRVETFRERWSSLALPAA